MKFHQWPVRPGEAEIKSHINLFYTALRDGKVQEAFTLCPVYTYREDRLLRNDGDEIQRLLESMFDLIDGYGYLDEAKEKNPMSMADTLSWAKFITPPAEVDYKDLALDVPSHSPADIFANLHIQGDVTDITGIFELMEVEAGWCLAFKMLKVM